MEPTILKETRKLFLDGAAAVFPVFLTCSLEKAALIVVLLDAEVTALGLDAERAVPLPPDVVLSVLSEQERQQLDGLAPYAATAIFSAKEAVYKALSPFLTEIWGFDAAAIRPDPAHGAFHALLHRPAGPVPVGARLTGVLLEDGTHIVSALCLPK